MVSAMLFVRCGDDPIDEPVGSKPVINLKTTEVEVAPRVVTTLPAIPLQTLLRVSP